MLELVLSGELFSDLFRVPEHQIRLVDDFSIIKGINIFRTILQLAAQQKSCEGTI